jgi:hypothetical protein
MRIHTGVDANDFGFYRRRCEQFWRVNRDSEPAYAIPDALERLLPMQFQGTSYKRQPELFGETRGRGPLDQHHQSSRSRGEPIDAFTVCCTMSLV